MKYSHFATLPLITFLAACNTSSTPFIDNCKTMVTFLAKEQNIEWISEKKTETNTGMLLVDLSYTGRSPDQTASCYFPAKNPDNEELSTSGEYRGSPTIVNINGQQVDEKSVINATLDTVREFGKKNYEELSEKAEELGEKAGKLSDKARDVSNQVTEKARKTALDAAVEVQKRLEKPAE